MGTIFSHALGVLFVLNILTPEIATSWEESFKSHIESFNNKKYEYKNS